MTWMQTPILSRDRSRHQVSGCSIWATASLSSGTITGRDAEHAANQGRAQHGCWSTPPTSGWSNTEHAKVQRPRGVRHVPTSADEMQPRTICTNIRRRDRYGYCLTSIDCDATQSFTEVRLHLQLHGSIPTRSPLDVDIQGLPQSGTSSNSASWLSRRNDTPSAASGANHPQPRRSPITGGAPRLSAMLDSSTIPVS
jgi:hypothetical protein